MSARPSASAVALGDSSAVLRELRSQTRNAHRHVEYVLALTDDDLTMVRLHSIVRRLGHFWLAAEMGLDRWAIEWPSDALALQWRRRRRSALFQDDVRRLGDASGLGDASRLGDASGLGEVSPPGPAAILPAVSGMAEALGRLYVLEGSSLGGQIINRRFAARPAEDPVSRVRLQGLAPYGDATGPMWQAFCQSVTSWVDGGGSAPAVVGAAVDTFESLDSWCISPGCMT